MRYACRSVFFVRWEIAPGLKGPDGVINPFVYGEPIPPAQLSAR